MTAPSCLGQSESQPRRFRTIVADPPWDVQRLESPGSAGFGAQERALRSVRLPYLTMTADEIAALPVADLAETDAHLYVWTINRYLEDTYDIARAWGFRPATLLTWAKAPMGLGPGGAFSQTTEHILFCRRGRDVRTARADTTWWAWKRGEHSAKPDAFLDVVEQVSPGPYLEIFARRARLGWEYAGDGSLGTVDIPGLGVRTPLTYYGGKQRIAEQILSLLPSGPVYIEPFAGGLAVLFARPRAQREVLNDLDGRVVAFWRAVRDYPLELAEAVASTPYSRSEWEFCRANPIGPTVVETARRLLVTVDHSYARSGGSWSAPALLQDRRGRWQPGTWENMPPRIVAAATRLQGVALEQIDAPTLIARSDDPGVVIYADPPYPRSTRSSGGAGYQHDDDGELWPRLVEVLLSIERAHVVLSSYPGPELVPLEDAGWRRVDLVASCASSVTRAGRGMAPEAVWLSPTCERAQQILTFEFDPTTTTEAAA